MIPQPRVGIVPLYLDLYDQVKPEFRPRMEAFARQVAQRLSAGGLAVEVGAVCCVRAEAEKAVADVVSRGVDLLATLHLSYSPSLESVDALAASQLPLLLLDTTPAPSFAEEATVDDMFRNHGIHGVQDLACMLRRRGRAYSVVVGRADEEIFIRRVVSVARAARAARHVRSMGALIFGEEFHGMGDFAVEAEVLASGLGVRVRRVPAEGLANRLERVSERDVEAETAADAERFDCSDVSPESLQASSLVGLAIRQMMEECGAGAFSFNFQSFSREHGLPTVPFLEAAKSMARGVGYAGEGDALTAALVGALLQGFGEVTFTEMFCPDWTGNALFMSHMGECNPALAACRPKLVEKEYAFGDVLSPLVAMFPLRMGPATLVNLAPGPADRFDLIASRVRILDRYLPDHFPDMPHFWVEPMETGLPEFLRRYSECGGTHHLALVMGDEIEAMGQMARMLGLKFRQIC